MKVKMWLLLFGFWGWLMANPVRVSAVLPKMTAEFSAKNLTTGSEWSNPVTASDQDIVRYRLTIRNADDTSPAKSVGVQIILPQLSLKLTQNPVSNVVATNGSARDVYAITNINGSGVYGLEYLLGTSRVTKAGTTLNISPDAAGGNLTRERVMIGDILAGEANRAIVEFDTRVIVKAGGSQVAPTPTPTAAVETTNGGEAVADKTPETGFMDQFWAETLKWAGVGAAGFGLKSTAGKLLKRAMKLSRTT